jgi:hypothetical protein
VSWGAQCRGKAALAAEVLDLLSGRRRGATAISRWASAPQAAPAGDAAGGGEASIAAELAGCRGLAEEVVRETDGFIRTTLEEWQGATSAWLAGIAAWKGSKLMSVDAASRHVNAHFSESLVVLLREVGAGGVCSGGWRLNATAREAQPRCDSCLKFRVSNNSCVGHLSNVPASLWVRGMRRLTTLHLPHSVPPCDARLQVRQLQALGIALRRDIMAEVEVAQKFYRWVGELPALRRVFLGPDRARRRSAQGGVAMPGLMKVLKTGC